MALTIHREIAADGTELHLVPMPPPRLPRVRKRDIEQAWEAARDAARAGHDGPARGFRFAGGPDVALRDRDARTWALSVDRVADLSTPHGISVCLRLLGLVALIGDAAWLAPFVQIGHDGAALDGALLTAAALTSLTDTGGLNENELRAMLITRAAEDDKKCSA
ncbi:MAG: hypothetical protein PHT60_09630 [Acidiphilium sp.]|nr:hypothetical protein [Acidiphilium sp.]MDD4936023.1 hypothetical protein [Acidiphilium sp.]